MFFLCKCNVMHLSIILWHCIINHNKIRFRAQSEKLFCWISLLPFTRSVNMTESLSCIWVCVCAEHELLSDTWTDCCGEHVHWLCEVTLRQRRTHTHHARTSLWVPQSFTTFQHGYLHAQWFLKEKSYIMTIKWSTFGWPASSASNKGVTVWLTHTDQLCEPVSEIFSCRWKRWNGQPEAQLRGTSAGQTGTEETPQERHSRTQQPSTHTRQDFDFCHPFTLSISRRLFVSALCAFLSQAWDWWRQRLEWFIRRMKRRRWRSRCL